MLKSIALRIEPAQHLVREGGSGGWRVTGEDPQFILHWRFPRKIGAGLHALTAVEGRNLSALQSACLYLDTGAGFNEAERALVAFGERDGKWEARVRFERPVQALRFDPSSGEDRPLFSLAALALRPVPQPAIHLHHAPKVLLNLARLLPGDRGAGGAGRVCLAMVQELPRHVRLRVAAPPHQAHLAAAYPETEFVIVAADDSQTLGPHLDWCDVYIDPLNALRPKIISPDKPVVALLYDLQHMRLPHFFPAAERRVRAAEYGYAAARADRLIAISDYERDNLRRYYGRSETSVVHIAGFMAEDSGLSDTEVREWRERARAAKPYLIYPAVPWAHKNHEILVQAVAILRRRGLDVPLVFTNTRGRAGHGERISMLAASLGVEDLIERKAFLPERELLEVTMNAVGMVFPSLYEGFGIPLADAMQLGVPVIAAKRAATEEVCGEAVAYFSNPQNAIDVANDLVAFWTDADARGKLSESGLQRAKLFSSARAAEALAAAVVAAIETKRSRGGGIERATPAPAEPFAPLSVLVFYRGLPSTEIEALRDIADITAHHAKIFGDSARVTVGLDIALAADPKLAKLFAGADRLLCLDARSDDAEALAAQDFAIRYDDAELHLITRYPECARLYDPVVVDALERGMGLHPDADYAVVEPGLADFVLYDAPSEIDGVLTYEARRRKGPVVFDAMIRREAVAQAPNGSFAFLSKFSTGARRLGAPEVRGA